MEEYYFSFYFSDLLYKAPIFWSSLIPIFFFLNMLGQREIRNEEEIASKILKERGSY